MVSKDSQRVFFSSKNAATIHGFDLAFRALRAAEIQVDRIWVRPSESRDSAASPFEDILIDVHFYFISLRNLIDFTSSYSGPHFHASSARPRKAKRQVVSTL
jgi:hypothetical protein